MKTSQEGINSSPVFVVGCARSGTTLLYHTLLSSGGFANYRAEPAVFDLLRPKFGSFRSLKNRRNLVESWVRSAMFRASGLRREDIEPKVLSDCRSEGDFLAIVMGEVARAQGVGRWAVWGPDNLLYMPQIKKQLPSARFIHMIRDGRDVTVSLHKERWIRPLPWDKHNGLLVAAVHWRWKVERGRQYAKALGPDCLALRYEDLVTSPRDVLQRLSNFVGYELDYDYIQSHAVGTLVTPNSSFRLSTNDSECSPVGRWKELLSKPEIDLLHAVLAPTLLELGYDVDHSAESQSHPAIALKRHIYFSYYDARLWCKTKTPCGRFTDTSRLRLEELSNSLQR